jgi:hypothetical protein
MILAWLLLLVGLTISAVAIYYSVIGLAAIFSAAVIPIVVMGSSLEVAKLVCASWLKANWDKAPRFIKTYMLIAVIVLMIITSMGIFGFLSKAHNDQNLVSGDVSSKIAIYDEKIKIARENIDANRKALKQLDEAVDQVMGRSTDEKGADKAVAIRRGQAKERTRLLSEITAEQKVIAQLNEERAPIAAEIRKVEAEVGPIKYIAKFIYGDKGADENMLEKAVTWVIILIVIVFDPLAVIMLLAAQMTFGWLREQKAEVEPQPVYVAEVSEPPKEEELTVWPFPTYEEITPKATATFKDAGEHPKDSFEYEIEPVAEPVKEEPVQPVEDIATYLEKVEKGEITFEEPVTADSTDVKANESKFQILPELEEESKKKTTAFMIKEQGQQIVKTKELDTSKTPSNPTERSGNA